MKKIFITILMLCIYNMLYNISVCAANEVTLAPEYTTYITAPVAELPIKFTVDNYQYLNTVDDAGIIVFVYDRKGNCVNTRTYRELEFGIFGETFTVTFDAMECATVGEVFTVVAHFNGKVLTPIKWRIAGQRPTDEAVVIVPTTLAFGDIVKIDIDNDGTYDVEIRVDEQNKPYIYSSLSSFNCNIELNTQGQAVVVVNNPPSSMDIDFPNVDMALLLKADEMLVTFSTPSYGWQAGDRIEVDLDGDEITDVKIEFNTSKQPQIIYPVPSDDFFLTISNDGKVSLGIKPPYSLDLNMGDFVINIITKEKPIVIPVTTPLEGWQNDDVIRFDIGKDGRVDVVMKIENGVPVIKEPIPNGIYSARLGQGGVVSLVINPPHGLNESNPNVGITVIPNQSGGISGNNENSGGSSGGGGVIPTALTQPQEPIEEPQEPTETNSIFNDLADVDWAADAINGLYELRLINGKGNNKFAPNDNITREEFVKMVVGMLDMEYLVTKELYPKGHASSPVVTFEMDTAQNVTSEKINNDTDFPDVDKSEWYADYIITAVKNNIITGHDTGLFGIGENISRQDMATVMYRVLQLEDAEIELPFDDSIDIKDYAKTPVSALYKQKLISGYPDGTFKPQNPLTRAETAVVLWRVVKTNN